MPTPTAAAKTERLLNLVIALLNAPRFRTAAWIRSNVAGYGDAPSDDAFFRMFERDKTELRELMMPLESDGEDGYRIRQAEFALPPLAFNAQETAAVGLAARLWSTTSLASAGEQALRKIRDAADDDGDAVPDFHQMDGVLQPRVRTADPAFDPLKAAVLARRLVRFDYRKQPDGIPERRRLHPWGLASYRGRWYVVGQDLDRGRQRTFRLSRIVGLPSATGKAGAYDVPAGIDLLEVVRRNAEPTVDRTARIRVKPGRAIGLRRGAELVSAAADETDVDVLVIPIVGLWDTARKIAANGPDVIVSEPADLQDAVRRVLTAAARGGA